MQVNRSSVDYMIKYEEEALGLFGHAAISGTASDTRRAISPPPSQWKRPPGRPRNSWLSVVSKAMKDVSISDAMIMAEDR